MTETICSLVLRRLSGQLHCVHLCYLIVFDALFRDFMISGRHFVVFDLSFIWHSHNMFICDNRGQFPVNYQCLRCLLDQSSRECRYGLHISVEPSLHSHFYDSLCRCIDYG